MDTGLLQRMLELDLTDILVSNDLSLVNRGAVAETFVGTELVKNRSPYQNDNLYCWHREKKNSNAEVDYVISRRGVICPIEVKSGVRGSMQSLRIFLEAKHLEKGIRTSLENFGAYEDILVVKCKQSGGFSCSMRPWKIFNFKESALFHIIFEEEKRICFTNEHLRFSYFLPKEIWMRICKICLSLVRCL